MDKKYLIAIGTMAILAGVGGSIDVGNEIVDGVPEKKQFSKDTRNYYYQYDENGNLIAEILTDKEIKIPNVYISDEKIQIEEWVYDKKEDKLKKIPQVVQEIVPE